MIVSNPLCNIKIKLRFDLHSFSWKVFVHKYILNQFTDSNRTVMNIMPLHNIVFYNFLPFALRAGESDINTIISVLAVGLEVLCGVRSCEKFATSDNFFWSVVQHDTFTESTFGIWFHSNN